MYLRQACSAGDHRGALNLYDEALELVCRASEHGGGVANVHAVLLSNRAAVYTQLEQYDNALASADAALLLRPAWDKAFFRCDFLHSHLALGGVAQEMGARRRAVLPSGGGAGTAHFEHTHIFCY